MPNRLNAAPLPHDSWAAHYESVMERTFGPLYQRLTQCALDEVDRWAAPGATILDVGAGCGRLTIPLLTRGYHVIAVERSPRMAEELLVRAERVAADHGGVIDRLDLHRTAIQSLSPVAPATMALSVFTVLAYALTDTELRAGLEAVHRTLQPGGTFLLDVPDDEVFESLDIESADLIREVVMTPVGDRLIDYREHTVVRTGEGQAEYRDMFRLRMWTPEEVKASLRDIGFDAVQDVSDRFEGLGARYLIACRPAVSSTGA